MLSFRMNAENSEQLLIHTPPFTSSLHESNDPDPPNRVSVQSSSLTTSTLSAELRSLAKKKRKHQEENAKKGITQVYPCPNDWCEFRIHTTSERSVRQCYQILAE